MCLTVRAAALLSILFSEAAAPTELSTLSLHDALPIWTAGCSASARQVLLGVANDPQILSYPMAKVGALHRCVPFCLHAEENPASSVCSFCTIRVENEPRESYLRVNFEYIETFYNRRRRHSTLQYLSPFA